MTPFVKERTKNMTPKERAKYLRFDSACKQASKCREKMKLDSCYQCSLINTCYIQEKVKTNQQ
jgi:hypothetical protein